MISNIFFSFQDFQKTVSDLFRFLEEKYGYTHQHWEDGINYFSVDYINPKKKLSLNINYEFPDDYTSLQIAKIKENETISEYKSLMYPSQIINNINARSSLFFSPEEKKIRDYCNKFNRLDGIKMDLQKKKVFLQKYFHEYLNGEKELPEPSQLR